MINIVVDKMSFVWDLDKMRCVSRWKRRRLKIEKQAFKVDSQYDVSMTSLKTMASMSEWQNASNLTSKM